MNVCLYLHAVPVTLAAVCVCVCSPQGAIVAPNHLLCLRGSEVNVPASNTANVVKEVQFVSPSGTVYVVRHNYQTREANNG